MADKFVMGAEIRMSDNFSRPVSMATKMTEEFKHSASAANHAVTSLASGLGTTRQASQSFADTLQSTTTSIDGMAEPTARATQGVNRWKAAMQQFNRGTETLKGMPGTIKRIAAQRLDGLETSLVETRLQAGLLLGSVKAVARAKVDRATSSFMEFRNTVTEGKTGLSGMATGLKNVGKISLSGTYNAMKGLTSKFKEFAGTKISGLVTKFGEFKTRVTGGETGVKGLVVALKKAAGVGFGALHAGLSKVGSIAASAGSKVLSGFGKLATSTVRGLGYSMAALGTGAIAAGAGIFKLTDMASNLDETLNKVDVSFGDSATEVKKWSENSIKAMGLSKQTALDMSALFGDMGTSMGIPQTEAAKMSMSLTQLGGDLASFKNINIDEVTTSLNGIFTGETESLKRLGIVMTQTNLDAFAMAKGFGKTTKEMTEAEKVNLRYAYVMDKTKNAQGDFVRTGGGFANQLRVFKETVKDIGTNMGKIFIPSMENGLQTLNLFGGEVNELFKDGWQDADAGKLAEIFKRMLDKGVSALRSGLPKVVSTVVPIINTLAGAVLQALPSVIPALIGGAMQILTSIISLVQSNKAPLITLAIDVVTSLATFLLDALPKIILVGAEILTGFVQGLAKQLPMLVPQAVRAIETIVNGLMMNMDAIVMAGLDIINGLIAGVVQNLPLILGAAMRLIQSVVTGLMNNIQLIINSALSLVQALVTGLIQNIPMLLQGALQLVMGIVNGLVSNIQLIINGAIALVNALVLGIVQNLPTIIQAAVQVVIALAMGLVQAIPQLIAAVPQLVMGIIDTILSTNWLKVGWDIVCGIGKGLLDGIKGLFSGSGKEGGEAIAAGTAAGLNSNVGSVTVASQTTANAVTAGLQPDYAAIGGYGATATAGLATGLATGAGELSATAATMGTDAMTNLSTSFTSAAPIAVAAAAQTGTETVTGLSTGITDSMGLATDASKNVVTGVTDTFSGIDLYSCGTNAMEGFNNGLMAMRATIMATANGIANSVKMTINSALDIHSPSRVMEQSGEFTGEGLAIGITKMIDRVRAAAQGLSDSAVEPFATRGASAGAIVPSGVTQAAPARREGLKIAIENIILQNVGEKDPKALVAEIIKTLYAELSGADEVLNDGEMGALLT